MSSSFSFSLLSTSWAVIANFERLIGTEPSSMLKLLSVEGDSEDMNLRDHSLSLLWGDKDVWRRLLCLLLTAIGECLGAIIPVVVVCDTGGGIDKAGTVAGTVAGCDMIAAAAAAAGGAGATDFFLNVFFKKLVNFLKRPCLGGCGRRGNTGRSIVGGGGRNFEPRTSGKRWL